MRWRPLLWLLVSLVVVAVLWRFRPNGPSRSGRTSSAQAWNHTSARKRLVPGETFNGFVTQASDGVALRFPFRLTNTSKPLRELVRSDRAVLLENAFLETTKPLEIPIPDQFRAQGDPGSYIIQSRGPLTDSFRALLQKSGGTVVAYIPNNAYLVRASASVARDLAASSQTAAVIPFEPYYKLKASLLELLSKDDSSTVLWLKVLLFSDASGSTISSLETLAAQVATRESSPFGPLLSLRAPRESLALLANVPEVQAIELAHSRAPANDLSRAAIGVSVDSQTPVNYLGLTGTNVLINVNDTGVDTNHPDLAGRVLFDAPMSGTDTKGHGTHVAGIIAGNGEQSLAVTNAPGSILPAVNLQFRGQAPAAKIFAMLADPESGPLVSDAYLQQTAARANVFISNNSWNYSEDNEYDFAAASYDAAVRDALPAISGSQPLIYIFPAGNAGGGLTNGVGGISDSIQSPATAKNVVTVGAIEQPRFIANRTWICSDTCVTNSPWKGLTDSSNQVAAFSSRGNVGIGMEGDSGRFKPDLVAPGSFVLSARSTQWDQAGYYSSTNTPLVPAPDTNYFNVLSNLNESVGPHYRFESGTSVSAAEVSGAVALMQEFFEQRLGRTNSPALMKALLINGARALGAPYNLEPQTGTNYQGWGLLQVPHAIPSALTNMTASSSSMLVFDQEPEEALATGEARTRYVSVASEARTSPLRVTLVWTDPPGNPVAGVKLVNDLDLIVTNLDNDEVFLGNDLSGNFNLPWNPATAPNSDQVNNVENIYLAPGLGGNYSITVSGHRVNVNSVTAHTNGVVQDYALVISSGDGQIGNALTLSGGSIATVATPAVMVLTNTFVTSSGDSGTMLLNQRVGANSPLPGTNTVPFLSTSNAVLSLGTLSQWHFYVITNTTAYTNAAFLTFLPSTLTSPGSVGPAPEPDIDLYVSRDPGLTNLDPAVLAVADASLLRGGTEMVVYSNATPDIYHVGVKSESQTAAEYGLLAVFSRQPFTQVDPLGNEVLRGLPVPAPIPNASDGVAGSTLVFGIEPDSIPVRRVIVTNILTHTAVRDLQLSLIHGSGTAILVNHSAQGPATSRTFIFDDSHENDVAGAQSSDGPGGLQQFEGKEGHGPWLLQIASTNQPGIEESASILLERQQDIASGITAVVSPGGCRQDLVYVPFGTSNLTATLAFVSGAGPVSWQLYPQGALSSNSPTFNLASSPNNASATVDATSQPPINPGLYVSRVCNLGPDAAGVNLFASLYPDVNPPQPVRFTSTNTTVLLDDAITISSLLVTNRSRILSTEVGVRLDHPRVSDLSLTVISPNGTRVLLDENRGGLSASGLGMNGLMTNITSVSSGGGPEASTNVLDTGETSGTINIAYNFEAVPDDMRVYYEGQLIYDSGLVSFKNSTNLVYGPGASTVVTIIMNEGGSTDPNTFWEYTVRSTHPVSVYFTFTENTNLTTTPIKFAPTPFTNLTFSVSDVPSSNGIYYLPEQSLGQLAGQSAFGQWTLEVRDSRVGATVPAPKLMGWQLAFTFQDLVPVPVPLVQAVPSTNFIGPGQIQWFSVDVAAWPSFATNSLLFARPRVDLLFNANAPPTGTNSGDLTLLSNSLAGSYVLQTNGSPPLPAGSRYYLGVRNTNAVTAEFALTVSFDVSGVVTLQSGVPFQNVNSGTPNGSDYYRYAVSTNAVRAQFEINGPSTNLTLVARKGPPVPSLTGYDFISANPGTNDELIVVYNNTVPIPLTPGDWYLAVINSSGAPASYSVMATEFPSYGTNLLLANPFLDGSSFCFSWNSLAGVHYFIQAKAALDTNAWTTISPTITATDSSTSYCVPLPSSFHFFHVVEGLVLVSPPPIISSVTVAPGGFLLQWTAGMDDRFRVQWSDSLWAPCWTDFGTTVTSTNGLFSFRDDGLQNGSGSRMRYYRLKQMP